MARKLARVVRVDKISPIPKADRIEVARVGGWASVIPKGALREGDRGVYLEIDSFLRAGVPAWQFLVDMHPTEFNGQLGHVLDTAKFKKQLSQGLLLPLSAFPETSFDGVPLETDVTDLLGVVKYDKPLPAELWDIARGYIPAGVPDTDQERVQNLSSELLEWQLAGKAGALTWEKSEKLEGESTSYVWMEGELHACSRKVDFKPGADVVHWALARELRLEEKLRTVFRDQPIALRGELIGPGVADNIYRLSRHEFRLFAVYDIQAGCRLSPKDRRALANELSIPHVPVLSASVSIDETWTMERLLAAADGPSALLARQRREGDVYAANEEDLSFKAVSNAYLLHQKL